MPLHLEEKEAYLSFGQLVFCPVSKPQHTTGAALWNQSAACLKPS